MSVSTITNKDNLVVIPNNPSDAYQIGYAVGYQDGKCDAASPWHRVEEELPEIGKAVVVSIYGDMWVATRLDDKRFNGRMYWELSDGSWERVENDMYWMPIEPPKEGK